MLNKKFTIAVIDDNVGDAELLRHHLTRIPELEMDFLYFDDPDVGLSDLLRRTVDFIFLDYRLGARNGLHILKTFRDSGILRAIIILSGEKDAKVAAELMKAGADDYLIKDDIKPNVLHRSMTHAYERYLRREAEKTHRELLTKTLSGSVRMLVDLLSTLKPEAFGRGERAQKRVQQICQRLGMDTAWEADLASLLSQVAYVFVPHEIVEKVESGQLLTTEEAEQVYRYAKMTSDMIRRIPRLGGVAAIVAYQDKKYDGGGFPVGGLTRDQIPLGARVLKIAFDFDGLLQQGFNTEDALSEMNGRKGWYDLNVMDALTDLIGAEAGYEMRQVRVAELTPEMILDEHLQTSTGAILVPKGEQVTEVRRERLRALSVIESLREPVAVRVPINSTCDPTNSLEILLRR